MNPPTRCSLWGWTETSGRILAGLASGLALALGLACLAARPPDPGAHPDPTLVVDPNTAPPEVLTALPRLGPALSGRIVADREVKPFTSLDDLDARVKGIGPATVAAIRPFLRFNPGTRPLAVKASDAYGAGTTHPRDPMGGTTPSAASLSRGGEF
jgi:competence protein ComEA